MTLAQRLYESGYITYMRTDSTNLSQEAVARCRIYIQEQYGDGTCRSSRGLYEQGRRPGGARGHPTVQRRTCAELLSGVDEDAVRLYDLIWRQFVACQMPRARYLSTTVLVEAGEFELQVRGRIMQFDGYTRVLTADCRARKKSTALPDFQRRGGAALADARGRAAFHQAAAPIWRGKPGARAGKTRHRPAIDVRGDHLDHSGSRVRDAATTAVSTPRRSASW